MWVGGVASPVWPIRTKVSLDGGVWVGAVSRVAMLYRDLLILSHAPLGESRDQHQTLITPEIGEEVEPKWLTPRTRRARVFWRKALDRQITVYPTALSLTKDLQQMIADSCGFRITPRSYPATVRFLDADRFLWITSLA